MARNIGRPGGDDNYSAPAADDPPAEVHPDAPLPYMGTCWICGDHADDGQEGYSSTPMVLPGLTKPVWVCGMCIIRAMNSQSVEYWRTEAMVAEEAMTVAEAINAGGEAR